MSDCFFFFIPKKFARLLRLSEKSEVTQVDLHRSSPDLKTRLENLLQVKSQSPKNEERLMKFTFIILPNSIYSVSKIFHFLELTDLQPDLLGFPIFFENAMVYDKFVELDHIQDHGRGKWARRSSSFQGWYLLFFSLCQVF